MKNQSPRWRSLRRGLLLTLVILVVLVGLGQQFGYPVAKRWVESESFRVMISRIVSKAIKVEGEFGPIQLNSLEATTPTFTSEGWPGEAIGQITGQNVRARFNPVAILQRKWQLDRIDLESGSFDLRLPNDALKRSPEKKPRPWYAFIMPSRFYVGWIDCQKAQVSFPFQGGNGRLRDMHLYATMIGRDFRYFSQSGVLEFPWLPDLAVKHFDIFVTSQRTDIYSAILAGLDGDPAAMELTGRIGMKLDKSIATHAKFKAVPFHRVLPPELKESLVGRATGDLAFSVDEAGKNLRSAGKIALIETKVDDWSWLNELARVTQNPDLRALTFDQAELRYALEQDQFQAREIKIDIRDKLKLSGTASYHLLDKLVDLNVQITDLPLSTWLPTEFKPRYQGIGRAALRWKGPITRLDGAKGDGDIDFSGVEIKNPVRLKALLAKSHFTIPDYLFVRQAYVRFSCQDAIFRADDYQLEVPDLITVRGEATVSQEKHFTSKGRLTVPRLTPWLPAEYKKDVFGKLEADLRWESDNWDLAGGQGAGTLRLSEVKITQRKVQFLLARFFKDDVFLDLRPQVATVEWRKEKSQWVIEKLDLRCRGLIGLRGNATLDQAQNLSGVMEVGLTPQHLRWLPEAESTVFTKKADGLCWARVNLSGTLEHPKHDLLDQIKKVLWRHPLALLGLGGRALSWWLGDLLGTYEATISR